MNTLLKPEVLNSIAQLELTARLIAEGYMSGSSRSQSVGPAQVFSQYRNYEAGDDLRQLDWKMYARSERYFIKQSDIESNITVKFMLDATASMNYSEDGISKLQYAKILIASLGWLARKQGDALGFYAVNGRSVSTLPPRFEQQHFMRFLATLIDVGGADRWANASLLYDHHGKELIIFFTDLYDEDRDLQHFIGRLKTNRNEVVVFQLIGKKELDLSFGGTVTFKDLETGRLLEVDTVSEQQRYKVAMNDWISSSRKWMLEKQIYFYPVTMDQATATVLRDFLNVRKKLIR